MHERKLNGEKVSNKNSISTDLFKGKQLPDFIKNHTLFKNPVKIQKVFPSIGMPNFREKANIDKCLVDVKKEGSYVHNLLRAMFDSLVQSQEAIAFAADRIQYIESKEVRDREKGKLNDYYNFARIISNLSPCIDPYNQEVLNSTIHTVDSRIVLKLMKDIQDNDGKFIYRKDESLFKIFNKIKDKFNALNIPFQNIEQSEVFKIFSKENIPNKEFSIIFSSDGEEGAWDILSMSMRGIKSCQRWDGEYPRCLIGSIFSKFVGIIYLTSGVQADTNAGFANLGTKMMRRCVVRYAIDADENKPCILIDKMYPELDKDVLTIFTNAIKSKTELPIYYAQDLGNRLRHLYLPSEKIRETISDREWSYQDTPLKSKHDLNIYVLTHNKDEVEREIAGFRCNLALFMARRMEDIYTDDILISDDEVKRTIKNIRMNTSFTPFCTNLVSYIMNAFRAPSSKGFTNSRSFYRKYLMEFLIKRKTTFSGCQPHITQQLTQNVSRTVDNAKFNSYISTLAAEFCKIEISKLIN